MNKEWLYKVIVTSQNSKDIDKPWEWCKDNLAPGTWSFDMSDVTDDGSLAVEYRFENKEDAARFNLTYG